MYTEEEINLIILSGFNELSYELKRCLLEDFTTSSPDFKNRRDLLIKTLSCGVYNKIKDKFYNAAYRKEFLKKFESKGITCVTYASDAYPETLANIPDPPAVLFCMGDTSLLKTNCFAVVGSRKCTPKMREDCYKISAELTAAFTVVTGLAEGADTAAAEGALDNGGKVISVLANGFDCIYPATNAPLLQKIARSGLAITEYPPDVSAKPYHFPFRNRIIAGLSRGTLVTAAGEKSGALITANYALEYGREVFAFPHSVGLWAGKGCNKLIKDGAHLTENILDIFGDFGLDLETREKTELAGDEATVYEAVKSFGEAHISEIANKAGKQFFEVIPVLSSLEIKKLVKNLGGNRFCIR